MSNNSSQSRPHMRNLLEREHETLTETLPNAVKGFIGTATLIQIVDTLSLIQARMTELDSDQENDSYWIDPPPETAITGPLQPPFTAKDYYERELTLVSTTDRTYKDSKVHPKRYGSNIHFDLGLCLKHHTAYSKHCPNGKICEWRHAPLIYEEIEWIFQLGHEKFIGLLVDVWLSKHGQFDIPTLSLLPFNHGFENTEYSPPKAVCAWNEDFWKPHVDLYMHWTNTVYNNAQLNMQSRQSELALPRNRSQSASTLPVRKPIYSWDAINLDDRAPIYWVSTWKALKFQGACLERAFMMEDEQQLTHFLPTLKSLIPTAIKLALKLDKSFNQVEQPLEPRHFVLAAHFHERLGSHKPPHEVDEAMNDVDVSGCPLKTTWSSMAKEYGDMLAPKIRGEMGISTPLFKEVIAYAMRREEEENRHGGTHLEIDEMD